MESHVDIRAPVDNYTYDLWGHTGDPSLTFKALLVNFLKGVGIPCPGLFIQAWVHFNSIDVDMIDKEYYQCRVFCCAATGSYDLESGNTMVFLVLSMIHYDSCSILRWNGLMIMLRCICLGLGSLAMSWPLRVKLVSECAFRELFSQFPMCWGLHQQHIQPQKESRRHLGRLWTIGYLVNFLALLEAILYSELWYEHMHSIFDFSYIIHLFNTTIFIRNSLITLLTKCPLCP